ncbi:kelch-like protein 20 isoform X2 [Amphiura filiformis]|uniref:kelch-like protein 20 isoform X2 n=1 Tax=Amphiura filiformis TaxID=82378 RepID=UPI003B2265D6
MLRYDACRARLCKNSSGRSRKRKQMEEKRELSQLRELISVLGTLRTKGVLCDVIVTVEGRKFKAHKAILASGCGYFRTLFSQRDHQSSEGCTTEIIIQNRDVNADSFENMLDYVYTGKLRPLVWDTIFETLACACYLQIKNAIQACTEFIDKAKSEGKLKFKDFFTISSMAGCYGVKELKETADKHIARDFSKISKTEEFLVHMSSQSLQDLLERNDLAISRERQVLEAVTRWLKHDWDTRKTFALPVLQKVRLGLVPIRNVIEGIDRQIREATECRDLYEELLERHALGEKVTGPLLQTHPEMLTPRKCRRRRKCGMFRSLCTGVKL